MQSCNCYERLVKTDLKSLVSINTVQTRLTGCFHLNDGLTCLFFYRVVKLLQSGEREETMHADSVFNQQLDKVHPVQD